MERQNRKRSRHPADADLVALDEFIQMQLDGQEPDVDDFLRGLHHPSRVLRQLLEGTRVMHSEIERFRCEYPKANLWQLAESKAQT